MKMTREKHIRIFWFYLKNASTEVKLNILKM